MSSSLLKLLPVKPPKELLPVLAECHLVADEKETEYFNLFAAIVKSTRPSDAVDWLYVKSIVDLTWDIRRERTIKAGIIEMTRKEIVLDFLKATAGDPASAITHFYRVFQADNEANQWALSPAARKAINDKLGERGISPTEVLSKAYIKAAAHIDAIERRIGQYEAQKLVILREIERRSARFSRLLEKASNDVVDTEFKEAAE
jgi:hypothetical protein